jgi:hypothetical protein
MELSVLCDVKVFMFIYDRNAESKLLHYQSDLRDDYISCLFRDCCNPRNFYSNDHYQFICGKNSASESNNGVISMSVGGDSSSYYGGTNIGLLPF